MIANPPKIVFVGAGRVATQLAAELFRAGFDILQIIARTEASAATLATKVQAEFSKELADINLAADLYILCVPDDQIAPLAEQLQLGDRFLVHTSGSTEVDVLKNSSSRYGVFYPLQTFSKEQTVEFAQIPILIEASDEATKNVLFEQYASKISKKVQEVSSEQRRILHLAAVFTCNFSNHLYAIAEDILTANDLSFDLLKPLMETTFKNISLLEPKKTQTGPALRNDQKTMEKHLALLEEKKDYQEIYRLLSHSIQQLNKN